MEIKRYVSGAGLMVYLCIDRGIYTGAILVQEEHPIAVCTFSADHRKLHYLESSLGGSRWSRVYAALPEPWKRRLGQELTWYNEEGMPID